MEKEEVVKILAEFSSKIFERMDDMANDIKAIRQDLGVLSARLLQLETDMADMRERAAVTRKSRYLQSARPRRRSKLPWTSLQGSWRKGI